MSEKDIESKIKFENLKKIWFWGSNKIKNALEDTIINDQLAGSHI